MLSMIFSIIIIIMILVLIITNKNVQLIRLNYYYKASLITKQLDYSLICLVEYKCFFKINSNLKTVLFAIMLSNKYNFN